MRNNQPVTNREYVLGENHFLISHTDLKGRITYANPSFIEVSGFSNEELVGAPHNIVRHPDMPGEAFADLWGTLQSGDHWVGLVKNRRKNGDYYWVRAQVTPIVERGRTLGYVSVRTRARPEEISRAAAAYALLRDGRGGHLAVHRGQLSRRGWRGALQRLLAGSAGAGLYALLALAAVLVAASTALGFAAISGQEGAPGWMWWAQLAVPALGLPLLALLTLYNRRALVAPLSEAVTFSVQIAAGNLAVASPAKRRGKTAELMASLDIMRKSLANIAGDVREGLAVVNPAARDIATGNDEMAARAQHQAASLQQTASSMEQMSAAVQQNTEHARQARGLAEASAATVVENGELMGRVVDTMTRITSGAGRMADVIEVIDSISFQTKLLALNASVEAARAGEQGRSFAVVAGEVHQLAGRSADAAKEVRELIASSASDIEGGDALVRRAGDSMEDLVQKVTRLSELMGDISSASEEQSSGIAQVTAAVADMDAVMRQDAERVRASAAETLRLLERVERLDHSASVFRFDQSRDSVVPLKPSAPSARGDGARPAGGQRRSAQPQALAGSRN
ncbi:methyl-accepting chemotaxis protein [Parahaliea mediterranea]|uniref:PAS domain-containing protein n=1 Tax=Parahaliea mediterranea TaxID=651086 RepID=A0A939IKU9_9GAMM|nr:PAS domain-containing methyl-accepting chemotaxis protein [Parahaliea mediterranea]MBN7795810.1 PAS domain-containing protein [Parahaliea mediterranea]